MLRRIFIGLTLFSITSIAKPPGPVTLDHKLGKITVFNKWMDEPINEPFQFFVTVECSGAGKDGQTRHEVVSDWMNCGLEEYNWDQYNGRLTFTLKHNNEKTDYKECSYRDKRQVDITDYCISAAKKNEKAKTK